MTTKPRVGTRFEHARQLDTTWTPGPGQKYADAPHVVMVITRIARGRIWYHPEGSRGTGFVTDAAGLDRVCLRFVDEERVG